MGILRGTLALVLTVCLGAAPAQSQSPPLLPRDELADWVSLFLPESFAPITFADLLHQKPESFWFESKRDEFLPRQFLYKMEGTAEGFRLVVHRKAVSAEGPRPEPEPWTFHSIGLPESLSRQGLGGSPTPMGMALDRVRHNRGFLMGLKRLGKMETALDDYADSVRGTSAEIRFTSLAVSALGATVFFAVAVKAKLPVAKRVSALGFVLASLVVANYAVEAGASLRKDAVVEQLDGMFDRLQESRVKDPQAYELALSEELDRLREPRATVLGGAALASATVTGVLSAFLAGRVLRDHPRIGGGIALLSLVGACTFLIHRYQEYSLLDRPPHLSPQWIDAEVMNDLQRVETYFQSKAEAQAKSQLR